MAATGVGEHQTGHDPADNGTAWAVETTDDGAGEAKHEHPVHGLREQAKPGRDHQQTSQRADHTG
jgi:hypothetical protein